MSPQKNALVPTDVDAINKFVWVQDEMVPKFCDEGSANNIFDPNTQTCGPAMK
jgi:hypothetical protein